MSAPATTSNTVDQQSANNGSATTLLAWKEWRENRLTIVFAPLMIVAILLIPLVGVITGLSSRVDQSTLLNTVIAVWFLTALYCGSTIAAPEIGNGSLQLLSTLPVSRGQIWLTKIGMSLLVMFAAFASSSLTTLLLGIVGVSAHLVSTFQTLAPAKTISEEILLMLGSTLFLFAVGSMVTMFADRTISALMGSAVVAAALYGTLMWVAEEIITLAAHGKEITLAPGYQLNIAIGVFVLMTVNLLAGSYQLFINGETLKTNKRLTILLPYAVPYLVILVALFIASLAPKA